MVGTNQKPVFDLLQDEDMDDQVPTTRGCCCCIFPCGMATSGRWSLLQSERGERCWVAKAKEVKEWSEVVAGPKWKTFFRRFRCGNGRRKAAPFCGYNPESYALNFDDGEGHGQDHVQEGLRYFSIRFACPSRHQLLDRSIGPLYQFY